MSSRGRNGLSGISITKKKEEEKAESTCSLGNEGGGRPFVELGQEGLGREVHGKLQLILRLQLRPRSRVAVKQLVLSKMREAGGTRMEEMDGEQRHAVSLGGVPVSYTHLTLPTICSV
eukprot:3375602-Rhodomonas_salina.3